MYLVDFKTFNVFANKNNLYEKEMPILSKEPFILEFKRGDIIMAKIEMKNINEYKFLRKYPTSKKQLENKYWIRGSEWKTVNGKVIQKLEI